MLRWNAFPFVRYTAALLAGIVLYLFVPTIYVWVLAGLIASLSTLIRAVAYSGPRPLWIGSSSFLALGCLGWLLAYTHTPANEPDNLSRIHPRVRAYEAIVCTQAEHRTKTYRLELSIRRVRTDSAWREGSGRVIVYVDKSVPHKPRYGDRWLVRGEPRPIDPPLNPGEFNYRRYLANRGIYHQQYLKPADFRSLGSDPPNPLTAWAYRVNDWADGVFTAHLGHQQEFAIVKAMILGVRDTIDPDLQQAYSVAGAVHVLSVSGLHVGVLFATLSFLLAFLKKGKRGKYAFAGIMLVLLWFYALMTGFSAPVLRSAFMFSLILIGQTIGRPHQGLNTLAASAFLILLLDPFAAATAGFQLSYAAVGALILWQRPFYQTLTVKARWADWLWQLTAVALVAQLITAPLGVFYFHQFPTYFWLANPIVIPLSSAVLVLAMGLLAVSWFPFGAMGIGKVLYGVRWLLNQSVRWTEQLPYSLVKSVTVTPLELALLYGLIGAGIGLVSTRNRRYVWPLALVALGLATSVIGTTLGRQHQRLFMVHFVPHQSVVSWVDGRTAVTVSNRKLTEQSRETSFYLRNTWDSLGVQTVRYVQADSMRGPAYHSRPFTLLIHHGKRILLVNRLGRTRWRLPAVVDYLVISRNALKDWSQLKGRVVARTIILDDSNKTPLVEQLLADARQRKIPCHSVRMQGAFLVTI